MSRFQWAVFTTCFLLVILGVGIPVGVVVGIEQAFIATLTAALVFVTAAYAYFTAGILRATKRQADAAFRAVENSIQREERRKKEESLRDITRWAEDIANSGIEPDTPNLSVDKAAGKAWPFLDSQAKKLKTLQLLRARSVYIGNVAGEIDSVLKETISYSAEKLRSQLKSLHEYRQFVEEYKDKRQDMDVQFLTEKAMEVAQQNDLLYKSAINVIEQVSIVQNNL